MTRVDRFSTQIEAFGLKDGERKDVPFSPHGTIDLLNPTNRSDSLFYSYTSIAQPPTVYCYNTREEKSCLWQEPNVPFDPSVIAVEETSYPSKDGTSIPFFLAARKDLLHSGPLPTFLTGYGGFGSCVTPRFTAFATFLIEQGLLFAVPALRGGSELGEQWHRAGKRENRQNSFDDFIAAAEWLISDGRSARGRIAIGGGSNAGLLVGATITQRPDLFRAAICLGPLLDMTRYHLFDFAAGWAEEYGSPEDEQDFHSLLGYSPYHHVQDGADYPAVLLISGDADTRCNPMHARKMAARLQAANRSRTSDPARLQTKLGPHAGSAFIDQDRRSHRQTRVPLSRTRSSCRAQEAFVMLFIRALLTLFAYDVLSTFCRFETIYSMVKDWKVTGTAAGQDTIDRVCMAVNYACIWYPKQALCLQRSFVTTYLLRKHGVPAHMVLGAQKLPFKAHAWVEVDGRAINERSNVQATYAVWDRC